MSAWASLRQLFAGWGATSTSAGAATEDVYRLARQIGAAPNDLMALQAHPLPRWFHYRSLERRKRDGSPRRLYEPATKLKALQRLLLRYYLEILPVHPAATGFRRGFSPVANARRHAGQDVVVTADIETFFNATSRGRIETYFRDLRWDEVTTTILTRLCTLRGALPQGAPTSPILSNLVNAGLDARLTRLVHETGGRYTRYGDDLTFSWAHAAPPAHFQHAVRRALLDHGYRLNQRKGWRRYELKRGARPRITGILLGRDGRLHPPPEVQQQMRRLRRQIRNDPQALARLQGYQSFVDSLRS